MAKNALKQGGFSALARTPAPERAQPGPDAAPRLSGAAYKSIMDALFRRRIPAGAFVSQGDLVELLGVPIQPLRDALRVLEAEGIVTIHPRAGIEFVKADMALIRSTYQFRTIIECAAVRNYAEKALIENIDALLARHYAFIDEIEKNGFEEGGLVKLHDIEAQFHGDLIQILVNPLIEATHRRLQNYTSLILIDRPETAPLVIRTLREHARVLEACRIRNADLAVAEMTAHLSSAMHRAMGL
jgi:DNA-binding GntR family transcriptional regulator